MYKRQIYGYGPFGIDIEVNNYEIHKLTINSIDIITINPQEKSLDIESNINITFIIETEFYPDFDHAIHDTEDDEWYVFGEKKTKFYTEESMELDFKIQILDNGNFEISFEGKTPEISFDIENIDPEDIIKNEFSSSETWRKY